MRNFLALPQHPSTRGFAAVLGYMKTQIAEGEIFPVDLKQVWEKILSVPDLVSDEATPVAKGTASTPVMKSHSSDSDGLASSSSSEVILIHF